MRKPFRVLFGIIVFFFHSQGGERQVHPFQTSMRIIPSALSQKADAEFVKIPLQFIPNVGQVDGPTTFYIQGKDKTIYFGPGGMTFLLDERQDSVSELPYKGVNPTGSRARNASLLGGGQASSAGGLPTRPHPERWVIKIDFAGANQDTIPVSLEDSGAFISYFKGKPEDWRTGIPASSKIVYPGLWPGIDLLFYGTMDRLKYEFIVHPGADASRIQIAYRGVEGLTCTAEGQLMIQTPVQDFVDDSPTAYQTKSEERIDIPVSFILNQDKQPRHWTSAVDSDAEAEAESACPSYLLRFQIGDYDRDRTLYIDPSILVYCGFIGPWSIGNGVAVDNSGNSYVVGYTGSTESRFPVTVGPDLTYNGGDFDAFVAKVNASGTALISCGYLGGVGTDSAGGVAIDGSGNIYIAGTTNSTESSFPVVVGPDLYYNLGSSDAFVAKMDASGTSLIFCGYIGGAVDDGAFAVAVDGAGNAYVSGATNSPHSVFAALVVGPDLTFNGLRDGFVAKVNAQGTGLNYCGYIGGSADEIGTGIAVDASGNAYLTGFTGSDESSFPVTGGPDLTFNGITDAFVAKVDSSGTALIYCGYIGGSNYDGDPGLRPGIAVDSLGYAYVTGTTYSSEESFPVKVGPDLTYNGGSSDAFIAKIDASGLDLVFCGYVGGVGYDRAFGIAVDGTGNAFMVGYTESDDSSFPVTIGPDLTYNGGFTDAFVAKVGASGAALDYCGYIGGIGIDYAYGIAVDVDGCAYVSGHTLSRESTFPIFIGPNLIADGNDAYVAKVPAYPMVSGLGVALLLPSSMIAGEPGFQLAVEGANFIDGAVVRWDGRDRVTTFRNSGRLDTVIGSEDIESGRTAYVSVRNPDGEISDAYLFQVDNPVPSLGAISPAYVSAGGPDFLLSLSGTGFIPHCSSIRWNGEYRSTTYLSGTQLEAIISSSDISTEGNVDLTIKNEEPGGGHSNVIIFPVTSFVISLSPATATIKAGQAAVYTIQVSPRYGPFDRSLSFNCASLPLNSIVSFSPPSVTPGTEVATTTMKIQTSSSANSLALSDTFYSSIHPAILIFLAILYLPLALYIETVISRSRPSRGIMAILLACMIVLTIDCGVSSGNGSTNHGTPKGTHLLTLRAESGNMTKTASFTLIVN